MPPTPSLWLFAATLPVNQADFQLNFAQSRFLYCPLDRFTHSALSSPLDSVVVPIRLCCFLLFFLLLLLFVVAVETTLLARAEGFGFLVSGLGFGFPHEFCAIAADLFAALHNHWKLV